MLTGILAMLLNLAAGIAETSLPRVAHAGSSAVMLAQAVVGVAVASIVASIGLGARTLLFYDLKVRKEAFDVDASGGTARPVIVP